MSLENRELNLTDTRNKINTLNEMDVFFNLILLDPEDFTKIVPNKVIGKLIAGYEGLGIVKADTNETKRGAIASRRFLSLITDFTKPSLKSPPFFPPLRI